MAKLLIFSRKEDVPRFTNTCKSKNKENNN